MKGMQFADQAKKKNINKTGKFRFINTRSFNQKQNEIKEKEKSHLIRKTDINDKSLTNTNDGKQPNVTNNICIIIKNSEKNSNQRTKPNSISINKKTINTENKNYTNRNNNNLKYINYTEYNNIDEIEEKPVPYSYINTESNETDTNKSMTLHRQLSKKQKEYKDLSNKIEFKQHLINNKKTSVKNMQNKIKYANNSANKRKFNINNYYNANKSEEQRKKKNVTFAQNNFNTTNSHNSKNENKCSQNDIDKLKTKILNSFEEKKNSLSSSDQIFNDIPMTNIQTCKNYGKEDKMERQEKLRKTYDIIESNKDDKKNSPYKNMRFSQSIEKKREMLGIPLNKNEFRRMNEKMEEELSYQKLLEVEKKLAQYKKKQEEIMKDYERRKIAQQNKKENREKRLQSLEDTLGLKNDLESNSKSCQNKNRKKSDLNKSCENRFDPFNYPTFTESLKNNSSVSVRKSNSIDTKDKKRVKFNNYNDSSSNFETSNKYNNYGIFNRPVRNSNITNFKKNNIQTNNSKGKRPISIKFKNYNQNFDSNYANNSFYNDKNNNYINKSVQNDYNNFNYTNNSFHNNYNYYNYNNNNINKNYNTNSMEMKEKIKDYINLEEAKKKDLKNINSYHSRNVNNNSKLDSYIKFITKETDRSKNIRLSPSLDLSNNIFTDDSYYDRLRESSNTNKSFGGTAKVYENYAFFSDSYRKPKSNKKQFKNENTPTSIKKIAIKNGNEISEIENEEDIKTIRVVQKRKKKVPPPPNKILQKIVQTSKKMEKKAEKKAEKKTEKKTEKKGDKKMENSENAGVGMEISAIRRINMKIQNYKNKNKNFSMKKRKKYEKKPQNKSLSQLANNVKSKLMPQNKSIRTLPDQNQNTLDVSFGDKC